MKDLSALDELIVGRVEPHIYAFTTNTIPNYLKIGDTYRPVSARLREWKQVYPELVKEEWRKTVQSAENFRNDYEFFSSDDLERNHSIIIDTLDNTTNPKYAVVFLTLQDLQGDNIKDKHAQIFGKQIDLLIVDETHFGARAEKYGAVLQNIKGDKERLSSEEKITVEDVINEIKKLDVRITLHLSGTPYRILMSDEFDK